MNRAHNSQQALESVKVAQDTGFSNITIDLIYGTPTLSNEQWLQNLETAFALNVPHLSCYSLTVEPKTALAKFIKKGSVPGVDETKSAQQFEILMRSAVDHGFEHYEISNFAKDKMYSRHNTNYWRNEKYLGLGPSAHSYNGISRQWNISNNIFYIDSLNQNEIPAEIETLTVNQQYNEYVLTSLRTMWGSDVEHIRKIFGENFAGHFIKSVDPFIRNRWVEKKEPVYTLTREGKFFADKIAMELFQE
jgi:oxygen-independent coproporphyrinogen-3 oxidase